VVDGTGDSGDGAGSDGQRNDEDGVGTSVGVNGGENISGLSEDGPNPDSREPI